MPSEFKFGDLVEWKGHKAIVFLVAGDKCYVTNGGYEGSGTARADELTPLGEGENLLEGASIGDLIITGNGRMQVTGMTDGRYQFLLYTGSRHGAGGLWINAREEEWIRDCEYHTPPTATEPGRVGRYGQFQVGHVVLYRNVKYTITTPSADPCLGYVNAIRHGRSDTSLIPERQCIPIFPPVAEDDTLRDVWGYVITDGRWEFRSYAGYTYRVRLGRPGDRRCPTCGAIHPYGDEQCIFCEMAAVEHRRTCAVRDWDDRSANDLAPESKDERLFGIEWEVQCHADRRDVLPWVRDRLPANYAVFKHDGSLNPEDTGGFEIVTRPDSLAVHRRYFKEIMEDNDLSDYLYTGPECGLHVHVTRHTLTPLQIGKMLVFVNESRNAKLIRKIAGRGPNRYCQVSKKKLTEGRCVSEDRYTAINVTDWTVEFRLFNGTTDYGVFRRYLEFVEALIEYCSPATTGIRQFDRHEKFTQWLDRKRYPTLWTLLNGKEQTACA